MKEKHLKIASDEGCLKREQIRVQTSLEKNKAFFVQMEIFQTRQEIKKWIPLLLMNF
jgi:hypothetical protein